MKQKKKRPTNDFKVRIVYSDYNDEETLAQEMKKMEEWIYEVLFNKIHHKSEDKCYNNDIHKN
jgi:hypothetical protein